jgi:site-specific recombinase XerD
MNEQQKSLYESYLTDLQLHGKSLNYPGYSMRLLFDYADSAGLDVLRLRVREAQDFQLHLTTMPGADGAPRLGKNSIRAVIGALVPFYEFMKGRQLCHANPFLEIQRIKPSKHIPRNILNEKDMHTLLSHLKEFWRGSTLVEQRVLYRAHVAAECMYATGMRIGELTRLTVEDINFERNVVSVIDSKTKKPRECVMNEYAARILKYYITELREYVLSPRKNDMRLLFGGDDDFAYLMNRVVGLASERLGFGDFTTHNFRHAVGYHLLKNGCGIRHIQIILGHCMLKSTQIYTKVDKEDLKHVIDMYHPRRMRGKVSPLMEEGGKKQPGDGQ